MGSSEQFYSYVLHGSKISAFFDPFWALFSKKSFWALFLKKGVTFSYSHAAYT
jgi:hypothetical protein